MGKGTTSHRGQNLVVAGVPITEGRAKGTWLTMAYNADRVAVESGVDGEAWFTEIGDNTATITVVLTHASRFNGFFANLVKANDASPTGLAFPIVYDELGGGTKYLAGKCKIAKVADGTWGDGAQVRAWTFVALDMSGAPEGLDDTPTISASDALALLP